VSVDSFFKESSYDSGRPTINWTADKAVSAHVAFFLLAASSGYAIIRFSPLPHPFLGELGRTTAEMLGTGLLYYPIALFTCWSVGAVAICTVLMLTVQPSHEAVIRFKVARIRFGLWRAAIAQAKASAAIAAVTPRFGLSWNQRHGLGEIRAA
jgi:hypothetical protein